MQGSGRRCELPLPPPAITHFRGRGGRSRRASREDPDVRSGPAGVSRKGGPELRMLSWNRKRLRILVGLLELQLIAMFTELEL
jgi:hypothetical protein